MHDLTDDDRAWLARFGVSAAVAANLKAAGHRLADLTTGNAVLDALVAIALAARKTRRARKAAPVALVRPRDAAPAVEAYR